MRSPECDALRTSEVDIDGVTRVLDILLCVTTRGKVYIQQTHAHIHISHNITHSHNYTKGKRSQ